ncbi:hypothetical protein [Achromobacter aloeverae]
MSVDLLLAGDRDLSLDTAGRTALVDGARRVAQQIGITLRAFLAEWFLDTTFGVPYFEDVLVKAPDRAQVEAVIRARIMAVPDVRAVTSLDLSIDREERSLLIKFEADTALGLVAETVTLSR